MSLSAKPERTPKRLVDRLRNAFELSKCMFILGRDVAA